MVCWARAPRELTTTGCCKMLDVDRRRDVRRRLLGRAREDDRIVGAAVTGSGARHAEGWSDVDLFFGVDDVVRWPTCSGTGASSSMASWVHCTTSTSTRAVPCTEPSSCGSHWRSTSASLLPADSVPWVTGGSRSCSATRWSSSRAPSTRHTPSAWPGTTCCTLGSASSVTPAGRRSTGSAPSATRSLPWRAIAWATRRSHAKGVDLLPAAVTAPVEATLVRSLDRSELIRALQAVTRVLLTELTATDPAIAVTLERPLLDMAALT